METVEFYNGPEGNVWICAESGNREFSENDREIIEYLMEVLDKYYPDALLKLRNIYSDSQLNKYYYEFRIIYRFVRCNFGENDRLSVDLDNGVLNFEEVKCPLRGICCDEGIICKPVARSPLHPAETNVARLYARGFSLFEIAKKLKKSVCTVNVQLFNIKKKLNLKNSREIIKIMNNLNL